MTVWEATSGRKKLDLIGHVGLLRCLAFSPDGSRLASAADDKMIILWDTITWQDTLTLRGHKAAIKGIAFSNDGTKITSCDDGGSVRIWESRSPSTEETDRRQAVRSREQKWPDSPLAMNNSSWSVAKEAGRSDRDYAQALRQAQAAVDAVPKDPAFLNTLGAALYRARRFAEAINCFEQGINLRSGSSDAFDWAFLAMAYARNGQRDQALRWLDQFRESLHPGRDNFSGDPEIRALRSEAEAVVLYDPAFPAKPFGH